MSLYIYIYYIYLYKATIIVPATIPEQFIHSRDKKTWEQYIYMFINPYIIYNNIYKPVGIIYINLFSISKCIYILYIYVYIKLQLSLLQSVGNNSSIREIKNVRVIKNVGTIYIHIYIFCS